MKILIYTVLVIGLGLIVFNATKLNLDNPFTDESGVAAIGVLAASCAVLLMVILLVSRHKKQKKSKRGRS
jgi:hypothetical protein